MVEEKIYYRHVGEHSQAGTSGRVQRGPGQPELCHVRRQGAGEEREGN